MAMTKEQQKAAAERIMAKEPMTEEERATFNLLTKRPGDYRVPGEERVCGVCGEKIRPETDAKGNVTVPVLEKFCDHQAFHNPTPGQWAQAHKLITDAKEAAKSAE